MILCPFTGLKSECRDYCALYVKDLNCCSFRVSNQIVSNLQIEQIGKTEEKINYLKSKLCDLDKT